MLDLIGRGGLLIEIDLAEMNESICLSEVSMRVGVIVAALACIAFPPQLIAQMQWEQATNIGKENTGDPLLVRCAYKTTGGFSFSTVVRSTVCPLVVWVNPETGQVRDRP